MMNYRHMPLAVRAPAPAAVLDLNSLKRAFFYIAIALMFIAPFSPDPLALAVGAAVPWVIMQIIARPGMPASVVYLFIWQWLQIFTRVLQAMVDNESIANGLYGPNVARAYWYMLAGLVAMALALRMVLGTSSHRRFRTAGRTSSGERSICSRSTSACCSWPSPAGTRPPSCRPSTSPSMPYRA
jgi:hypothetical protein